MPNDDPWRDEHEHDPPDKADTHDELDELDFTVAFEVPEDVDPGVDDDPPDNEGDPKS
jgi:hypothetical protein